jgi:tape measure domain-containing protein
MPTPAAGLVVKFEADTKKLVAGLKQSVDEIKRTQRAANREGAKMRQDFKKNTEEVKKQTAAIKKNGQAARRTTQSFMKLGQAIAAVYTVRAIGQLGADILNAADRVRLLQGRLQAVSGDATSFARVTQVAEELGATVQATGGLFTKLAIGTKRLGATAQEITKVTKAVLQLGRVSGLTFAETDFFARQLGQGIASGAFQGDELRSVRENLPVLAQQIANALTQMNAFGDGVRVTAGDLKRLGKEGKLNSETMFRALKFIADSGIAEDLFAELPDTFEQATNRITTQWGLMVESLSRELERAGLYDEIARLADAFKFVRLKVATQGWDDLGKEVAAQLLAGLLEKLGDFIDTPIGWGPDEVSRWLFGGTPGDVLRSFADGLREAAPTELSLEGESLELLNEREWEQFYGLDELRQAVDAVVAEQARVQEAIMSMPTPSGGRNRFDETGALMVGGGGFGVAAHEEMARLEQRSRALAEALEILYGKWRLLADSPLPEIMTRDTDQDVFGNFAADANKLVGELDKVAARVEAARTSLQAYNQLGEYGLERQEAINKALQAYARIVKKTGEENLLIRQMLIDKYLEELELTERLNLAQKSPQVTPDNFGEQSAGTAAGKDVVDISGILKANDKAREEITAYADGGEEALKRLRMQYEINARVAERTTATQTEAYRAYIREITTAEVELEERVKSLGEATNEMSAFADQAARNMQDAFADYLFDPFDDGLKGMLRGFIDIIRRMIAEMVAFKVFESIGIAAFLGGARAMGGPVSAGAPYLVGEKGPEIFVPDSSGTIIPNHKIPEGTAGSTEIQGGQIIQITQNIDARGNDDPSKILAMMPSFADAIKRDIRDEISRGRM